MSDIRQLAIEFAREVIGWQDAALHHSGEYSVRQFAHQSGGRFYHSSLDEVVAHVANWCDQNGASFIISYCVNDHVKGVLWNAEISGFVSGDDDSRIALMEACLNAQRERAQEHAVMP